MAFTLHSLVLPYFLCTSKEEWKFVFHYFCYTRFNQKLAFFIRICLSFFYQADVSIVRHSFFFSLTHSLTSLFISHSYHPLYLPLSCSLPCFCLWKQVCSFIILFFFFFFFFFLLFIFNFFIFSITWLVSKRKRLYFIFIK